MEPKHIILHLSLIPKIASATICMIINAMADESEYGQLYTFLPSDFVDRFEFTPRIGSLIYQGLADRALLDRELSLLEKHSLNFITIADSAYPELLKNIYLPPALLYIQGAPLEVNAKTIAVIGARKADGYGQRIINHIVPTLVHAGWTIVSGGAVGADAMAHQATIDEKGKTVVVLGSGLLKPYPHANKKLFAAVLASGGTIISECPLLFDPLPGNFPARNRIISGLSRGCVVVQAARQSGARITAQLALEQGREVFAVPGIFDEELSDGCHALIQEGAKLITSVDDILVEFDPAKKENVFIESPSELKKSVTKEPKQKIVATIDRSTPQGAILHALAQPCNTDELIAATGIPLSDIHALLFDLQISGSIIQNFAGNWERIR
jgi:DNA processing protein